MLDSSLTFSEPITNLTCSSYYELQHLGTICKSVSTSTMTVIFYAFIFYASYPSLLFDSSPFSLYSICHQTDCSTY